MIILNEEFDGDNLPSVDKRSDQVKKAKILELKISFKICLLVQLCLSITNETCLLVQLCLSITNAFIICEVC